MTLQEIQTGAEPLHAEIDKAIAEAKKAAPWLIKARASLSDALGHIGSHASEAKAEPEQK